jgi:hypothetical protein
MTDGDWLSSIFFDKIQRSMGVKKKEEGIKPNVYLF